VQKPQRYLGISAPVWSRYLRPARPRLEVSVISILSVYRLLERKILKRGQTLAHAFCPVPSLAYRGY